MVASEARVVYGCCVGSWERFHRYVLPRTGNRDVIALANRASITGAYNEILGRVREVVPDVDMLILLHDDLELTDPHAEDKFLTAVRSENVAIAGVAGGRCAPTLAWWNGERFGHQMIDSGMLELGPREGDVDGLEGSVMALSPWAIANLDFDERFTGFHCCDEISWTARSAGRRNVVVDVGTHHHTRLGFRSGEARREWESLNELLKKREAERATN